MSEGMDLNASFWMNYLVTPMLAMWMPKIYENMMLIATSIGMVCCTLNITINFIV